MPGPVPKRSDQRRRRNDAGSVERIAHRPPTPPPLTGDVSHPVVRAWYEALGSSPQAVDFALSDYMTAQLVAIAIDNAIYSERGISANMLSAFTSAAGDLLATAGERRRLRMEFVRAGDGDDAPDDGEADVLAFYSRGASG